MGSEYWEIDYSILDFLKFHFILVCPLVVARVFK